MQRCVDGAWVDIEDCSRRSTLCNEREEAQCDGVPISEIDVRNQDADGDGYTPNDGDCNDSDPSFSPGADEICDDGNDNNCDGLIDEAQPFCQDNDVDGFTPATGDCADGNESVNPAAVEVCDDGRDNNCNMLTDGDDPSCVDGDGDGVVLGAERLLARSPYTRY